MGKNIIHEIQLILIIMKGKSICMINFCNKVCVLVTQLCPTLWDLMNYSPPGSSVHRDSPRRILEWVAVSFSRGSSHSRDRTQVSRIADGVVTVWGTGAVSFLWFSLAPRIGHDWSDLAAAATYTKNLPPMLETWVWSLGEEDPLEKETATHSIILAWEIPWTEEPGGLRGCKSRTWLSD